MNYEKKYKDALIWMASLYDGLHGKTKEEAERFFPELKENGEYSIAYGNEELLCIAGNPIDACYEMILKLKEQKLL